MAVDTQQDVSHWYAIQTHHKQETRVEANLTAWKVETFVPKLKECRTNQYTYYMTYIAKPMFPRYVFARFRVSELLHKINYTRGVQSVVSFGGLPIPIDDNIIDLLKSRVRDDGFIRLEDELKTGDKVVVKGGAFEKLSGVFDSRIKNTDRVIILLTAISYQGRIVVERGMVSKQT